MASFKLGKIKYGFTETATSGGTLNLTASSKQYQILTGSSSHTVVLPDATTMALGLGFVVVNTSSSSIVVQNSGLVTLVTISAGGTSEFLLTDISTANGVWRMYASGSSGSDGIVTYGPAAPKTSDYAVVTGDKSKVINVDTSGGPVKITLPSPAADFNITIKDFSGAANVNNAIRIARSSDSVKIDGEANDDLIVDSYVAVSYISNGTDWFRIGALVADAPNGMAIFNGGAGPSNVIDYILIPTTGNAVDFGDLTSARTAPGSCASAFRGIIAGGGTPSATNSINYVTFDAPSNATNFGNLTTSRDYVGGASNNIRGIFAGGYVAASYPNVIDYVTMATLGNAIDFGDLVVGNQSTGGLSSTTRSVFATSGTGGQHNDYVTIATLGNALSFGDLSVVRANPGAVSSPTRGLFCGGNTGSVHNEIDYITIAVTGNAVDFGDLTVARYNPGAGSSHVRGVIGGGGTFAASNVIDYATIATLGNATDFGDLTVSRAELSGCSNAHGGIGG